MGFTHLQIKLWKKLQVGSLKSIIGPHPKPKNAYSSVLLLPGFYHLRFHHMLLPFMNTNVEKYASFWDCTPMILSLLHVASPDYDQDHDHSSLLLSMPFEDLR